MTRHAIQASPSGFSLQAFSPPPHSIGMAQQHDAVPMVAAGVTLYLPSPYDVDPIPQAASSVVPVPGADDADFLRLMSERCTWRSIAPIKIGPISIIFTHNRMGSLTALDTLAITICCGCPVPAPTINTQYAPDYSSWTAVASDGTSTTNGVLTSVDTDKRLYSYSYSGTSREGAVSGTLQFDFRNSTMTIQQFTPRQVLFKCAKVARDGVT